jgi:hypothetical protein
MSPMQYEKRPRLTEMRQILLAEDLDAASAVYRGGYQPATLCVESFASKSGSPASSMG